jgi:hypothetical protein
MPIIQKSLFSVIKGFPDCKDIVPRHCDVLYVRLIPRNLRALNPLGFYSPPLAAIKKNYLLRDTPSACGGVVYLKLFTLP